MSTLTEGRYAAEFLLSEGNGNISREVVTVVSGAGALKAGTVLGKVTASGKYKAAAADATDGSEDAIAIALYDVDATSADAAVAVIARNAEVNGKILSYHASVNTDAEKPACAASLATAGIIVR